jgi:Endodeoxyribonuclease RusA.
MIHKLIIDGMPPNLNVYRNMHYRELDKEKKEWSNIVRLLVLDQKLKPIPTPIHQTYTFWFKDKREHDPDNYACCAKFINDGLVDAGILKRDNFQHIKELTVREGGISKKPYIEITMEEVS